MKHATRTAAASTAFQQLRHWLSGLSLLIAVAIGLTPAAHAETTKIRIGLIGTNESQIPILLAIDKGYFKTENLDVEPVHFAGGGIAVQAFVGGSIELASFATDHVLRLDNRGGDARFLIGIDRFITHILVVPAGKGYKSFADLKGKKIGVTAPGSYSDNVLRWELAKRGINPDRDVTIIGIGDDNAATAGLQSGQIDALITTTSSLIQYGIEQPGKLQVLYDWRSIPHSGQAVIGRQRWIDSHPEAARGVARAVLKAEQTIQTDPEAVKKIIRQQFPGRSEAFVDQYAAAAKNLLSRDGRISHDGFLKMTEILRGVEPGLKPIDQAKVDLTDKLLGR
ncbi:ABC transporter substrate-binding protein [Chitinasiproducens palmae]|uniref:NitT/TauT family transport system substrate-binding protein n=1 Tax=Chitinasiproducens palmae TaxID=1770053 RepID=A0A1H2PUG3_9BURK|nr:ABC transporter substrate-binding protein [Chitinasiproducens palmae]SDV50802.1 NitT/TauT family transport system substrate-binding protein [Chitinasiproducens palmae]